MGVSAAEGFDVASRGSWARWKDAKPAYTVGVEEEVMLLEPSDHSLAERSDAMMDVLSPDLTDYISQETHAGVLELRTGVHLEAAEAVSELWRLRQRLTLELHACGATTACAGMHPLGLAHETRISESSRYRLIADSMRFLARREPTMALHIHVAVPDPEAATRVLRRLRECVPLLVALAANSPFSRGRDTGFASARTVTFDAFPRTGLPRAFDGYGDYVEAIDALIASGVVPDPTFLWWDVRLQPALGTVEVRAMDAQSTVEDTASLVALVQSLTRMELESSAEPDGVGDEVLAENRFLAARDGLDAGLIDAQTRELVPARIQLERLLESCRPHAAALGCLGELDQARWLTTVNGAIRQRTWVASGRDLSSMLSSLARRFTAPLDDIPTEPLAGRST